MYIYIINYIFQNWQHYKRKATLWFDGDIALEQIRSFVNCHFGWDHWRRGTLDKSMVRCETFARYKTYLWGISLIHSSGFKTPGFFVLPNVTVDVNMHCFYWFWFFFAMLKILEHLWQGWATSQLTFHSWLAPKVERRSKQPTSGISSAEFDGVSYSSRPTLW